MPLQCPFNKPQSSQNVLDDFDIITTSPFPPTNAVLKTNILFWIRVIFLWGNAVCFCRGNFQTKHEVLLEKLHQALWRSAVCISRCLALVSKEQCPFRKANISAQYLQYFWQRSCLSKVQYVWNCENYWRTLKNALMLLTTEQQNIVPYGRESSCEEAAFLENWTCIWHVYSSPWSDQPSLHLDNSHFKKCFQYYRTIMFSFNRISHSYQGGVSQIQQQILQGRPYSFKRVLHA